MFSEDGGVGTRSSGRAWVRARLVFRAEPPFRAPVRFTDRRVDALAAFAAVRPPFAEVFRPLVRFDAPLRAVFRRAFAV
jgi:hypothetical protein